MIFVCRHQKFLINYLENIFEIFFNFDKILNFLDLLIYGAYVAWQEIKELQILIGLANKVLKHLEVYFSCVLQVHFIINKFCHKIWALFWGVYWLFVFYIAYDLKKIIKILEVKGGLVVLTNEVENEPVFLCLVSIEKYSKYFHGLSKVQCPIMILVIFFENSLTYFSVGLYLNGVQELDKVFL